MITGYVGLIGQGKTMLAVREARELAARRGAILASNIWIDPPPGVEFRRLGVGEDGIEGVPALVEEARHAKRGVVLVVDEIGIILPARYWQTAMSIDLMWSVSQSRKLATDLIYTAQDVEQVDAFLRRLTQWVHRVRAVPNPSIERREAGKRPWFFVASRYRPSSIKDGIERPDKRLGRSFVRYRRSDESVYNTDELVRPPSILRGKRSRRGSPPSSQLIAVPGSIEPPAPATAERRDPAGSPPAPHEYRPFVSAVAAGQAGGDPRSGGDPA